MTFFLLFQYVLITSTAMTATPRVENVKTTVCVIRELVTVLMDVRVTGREKSVTVSLIRWSNVTMWNWQTNISSLCIVFWWSWYMQWWWCWKQVCIRFSIRYTFIGKTTCIFFVQILITYLKKPLLCNLFLGIYNCNLKKWKWNKKKWRIAY